MGIRQSGEPPTTPDLAPPTAAFLHGGGAMGGVMRAHDWTATPVGRPETWSQALRTVVRLMLTSLHPMFIWWGPAFTCFYNDAYSAVLGPDRHPSALGRPGREVWAEIWEVIGPNADFVMSGAGAIWHERQLIPITRGDAREDVWWTYGYSPIDDDSAPAGIGGVLVVCRDVTAEVRGEHAQAEQATRLHQFFEQAPGFMAMLRGPDHVFELTNAAYLRLVGREVVGLPLRLAVPEVAGQGFLELLDRVYATGIAFNARRASLMLAIGPGGAMVRSFLDFVYQPIRDATGMVTGIFVEGSDVTEATLAEESLRANEARQALLLDLTRIQRETDDPDAMMLTASQAVGRHLGANRVGFFEMLDQDTLGFTLGWTDGSLDLITGTFPAVGIGPAYLAQMRQGATLGIADVTQDKLTAGSVFGEIGARSIIGAPISRGGVWQAGMYVNHGTARDWTETEVALVREVANQTWDGVVRVRAVAALRANEAHLRNLLERLPVGVAVADGRGRVTYGNPALERIVRHPMIASASVPEYGAWHAMHPDGRPYAAADYPLARGLRGETYDNELARYRRGDGTEIWIRVGGIPLRDEAGQITGALGVVADVDEAERARRLLAHYQEDLASQVEDRTAELMAAEAQLRQAQKIEVIGQLTGGIAHDLNNMLQAVASALELLQRRLNQGRIDEAGYYIDSALKTVDRAAALTHRLLAFARRQVLQPRLVELNALVLGLAELIRRTMGAAVQVEWHMAATPLAVLCDPNQFENALLNLAINARDAMPDGGRLTIAIKSVYLGAAEVAGQEGSVVGEYVQLAVSDTGIGMDQATQSHVFEPFFTTKPIGQGTGLGLSQLYGFVRQSNGVVWIDSAPGRGTTVSLLLPRQEQAARTEEHTPAPLGIEAGRIGTGERVLLVEDEDQVREMVANALRELGYAVSEAPDGAAAMRLLHASERFDILVTDVGLPAGLNGRQVADAARERHPGLPVLFITGYAGNSLADQLAPAMEVISKPFTLVELARRVRALLDAVANTPG